MPKYRVPIHGALLIEADSEQRAQIFAGVWTVSVRQMTQKVTIQDFPGILGAMIAPIDPELAEITDKYAAKRTELEVRYAGIPQQLAQNQTNYFVGEQMWFEQFEKEIRS